MSENRPEQPFATLSRAEAELVYPYAMPRLLQGHKVMIHQDRILPNADQKVAQLGVENIREQLSYVDRRTLGMSASRVLLACQKTPLTMRGISEFCHLVWDDNMPLATVAHSLAKLYDGVQQDEQNPPVPLIKILDRVVTLRQSGPNEVQEWFARGYISTLPGVGMVARPHVVQTWESGLQLGWAD